MKTILAAVLFAVSTGAMAHGYSHHGHWHRHNNAWVWVVPTIMMGGVIGYEIARNAPPSAPPPPVVVQQPSVVIQQPNCSPWTEIQNPDGSVTRTRTCQQ